MLKYIIQNIRINTGSSTFLYISYSLKQNSTAAANCTEPSTTPFLIETKERALHEESPFTCVAVLTNSPSVPLIKLVATCASNSVGEQLFAHHLNGTGTVNDRDKSAL